MTQLKFKNKSCLIKDYLDGEDKERIIKDDTGTFIILCLLLSNANRQYDSREKHLPNNIFQ